MAKSIVFCADGTWNGPGQGEEQEADGGRRTNVYKLFLNLDGTLAAGTGTLLTADEQEKVLAGPDGRVTQIAKYLHGVGDSRNFLVRMLGGGGGAGLVTRVVRGYTFISRNFEPGDRIFIVGFSRGAYTARALAGLIAARGLLDDKQNDLSDRDQAYRLGSAEWFTYRRGALRSKPNLLHRLAEVSVDLPRFLSSEATAARIPDVIVEAVVVWDTVGALGIPAYNLKTDTQLDAFQFADLILSEKVRHGLHAVSIDEQRAQLHPHALGRGPAHHPGPLSRRARRRGRRLSRPRERALGLCAPVGHEADDRARGRLRGAADRRARARSVREEPHPVGRRALEHPAAGQPADPGWAGRSPLGGGPARRRGQAAHAVQAVEPARLPRRDPAQARRDDRRLGRRPRPRPPGRESLAVHHEPLTSPRARV
jgi:hypothetical protein